MKLKLFIFSLAVLSRFTTFSQDFNDLKDQKIEAEHLSEIEMEPFISNVYTFLGDDFDSLDLEIVLTGPILGSILVQMAGEDDGLTYGRLYDKFLEIKNMPGFSEIRIKQKISTELMGRPANYANWEEDKLLFEDLGLKLGELEKLRLYVKENSDPSLNYKVVLEGFQKQNEEENEVNRDANKLKMGELIHSSVAFDEAKILAQSKNENKPILVYFTGHNCLNCRKIEQSVLNDTEVLESLSENFIFVALYVDDRTELPKEEQVEVFIQEHARQLKTVGDKNSYYQMSEFNTSAQPYFVVLNSEKEVLETATYKSSTVQDYLHFLNNSLDKFAE